jgi:hypothetical protein
MSEQLWPYLVSDKTSRDTRHTNQACVSPLQVVLKFYQIQRSWAVLYRKQIPVGLPGNPGLAGGHQGGERSDDAVLAPGVRDIDHYRSPAVVWCPTCWTLCQRH